MMRDVWQYVTWHNGTERSKKNLSSSTLKKYGGGGRQGGEGVGAWKRKLLSNGTIEYSWENATVMCPSFFLAPPPLFWLRQALYRYLLHRDKKDYTRGYRMVISILAVLALSREVCSQFRQRRFFQCLFLRIVPALRQALLKVIGACYCYTKTSRTTRAGRMVAILAVLALIREFGRAR